MSKFITERRTSRRAFLQTLLVAPLVLRYTPAYAGTTAPTKRFTILHSNDPHGHLLPFSYADKTSPGDFVSFMPEHKHIGGLARRATLIKGIKNRERNVHVFDCGDSMDGSPFSIEYRGKADYAAMSVAGFDIGTFGNHDFNMTAVQFNEMRDRIKYPRILANVYDKATGASIEKPYVIENWDGLKVAILGLTTYDSRTYTAIQQAFTMRDPLDVASEMIPKLRAQADLVVLISHMGYDQDKRMARDLSGIDVIIGAHSHTRLPVGDYEYAARAKRGHPQGTVITQAHCWGGELGRLDFQVQPGPDGKWRVAQYTAALLMVDDRVKEDKAVADVIAHYWNPIKAKYEEVIGQAADEFVEADSGDATNYYLMCDAIHAGVPGAQFEIENFGGVRAPILKGTITRSELIEVDPFTNTIVSFGIKGADLKKLLGYTRPAPSKTLRYTATAKTRTDGKKDWSWGEGTLNGVPIGDDTVYQGAASSFYFNKEIKRYAIDPKDTGRPRLEFLADYIKKNSPISPTPDGRMKLEGGTAYD